jgi:diguanylate cyclase (GGDEF)-like protein/PAS domain S-box-containing protein
MNQDTIIPVLYDMALVIGGEDRVDPLLVRTLTRLLYHTSFPCGLILNRVGGVSKKKEMAQAIISAGVGDYRLKRHVGSMIHLPAKIFDESGYYKPVDYQDDYPMIPVRSEHYRYLIILPIPDYGVILLFSPLKPNEDLHYGEIFYPVLASLSRAIRLCLRNEKFTEHLIADRNEVRKKLVRFRLALDTSPEIILLLDYDTGGVIDYNHTFEKLGYGSNEIFEKKPVEYFPELTEPEFMKQVDKAIRESDGFIRIETSMLYRDGRVFPCEIRITKLIEDTEQLIVILLIQDITERKKAQDELFEEKERALITLHSIGDGVITTDQNRKILYLNPVAERMTGWNLTDAKGMGIESVFNTVDDQTGKPGPDIIDECLSHNRIVALENRCSLQCREGGTNAIDETVAPILDREGRIIGSVLVFHDVADKREMTRKVEWQAMHDPLTGLVNRREFERCLEEEIQRAKSSINKSSFLYLDLDQFKIINDTCGHLAGDSILKQVSGLLQTLVDGKDSLARLGGDEFGVLLIGIDEMSAVSVAENIRENVSRFRFIWNEKTFEIGVSIGIVEINSKVTMMNDTIRRADMACIAAKDLGRNCIHIARDGDDDITRRRGELEWVSRIKDALKRESFTLFKQSIVPLKKEGGEKHYEILVRMVDDERGIIVPEQFIPIAERFDLMPRIDRWVFERSLALYPNFLREDGCGDVNCVISINLSGNSLNQETFLEFVRDRLTKSSIDPGNICFEITETTAISNLYRAASFIKEMKNLGCRFSIDDFGSGLSSFAYLKKLPVNYLKIDGEFVRNMAEDPVDLTMVKSINQLGHVMGLETIAEYVENTEILDYLILFGVDYAQGFHIDRPSPIVMK